MSRVSPSSPERLATESTSGDGYSPGKPLDLTLNVIDSQKMVGTDDARVLEKVNGVQTVELNCEPVAMEASIIHTVDSCGNMSSDVLLVDSKSGLDNGSGSKNDDGLTMVTMNKEETTLKLSFRDMVVGKNQNESLVSEILELDVLIGDGDVRFGMEDVDNSCATKTMEIVDIIVSEPENHYGPWMQVMPLQNKRNMARKDSGRTSIGNLSPTTNGNSFDAFIVEDKDLGIQDNGVEGIHVEPIVSKVTKNPKAQRVMATQMNGKTGASSSGTRRRSMESNVV
ncbi:hypothetical protein V6N13_043346 [Hibiscus sabdariffa]